MSYQEGAYFCYPRNNKARIVHYLAPFDSLQHDATKLFPSQTTSSPETPFYSLQLILNRVLNPNDNTDPAREALVQIFVFKGVHHFIQCLDVSAIKMGTVYICNNPTVAHMCVNYKSESVCPVGTLKAGEKLSSLWSGSEAYAVNATKSDNVKVEIKAADCRYLQNELALLSEAAQTAYRANCVNVAAGERA